MTTIASLIANCPTLERFEFFAILETVLNQKKHQILLNPDQSVSLKQERKITQLIQQRLAGTPLAYLLKNTNFYGLSLFVNKNVLIPRPETEQMVEIALSLPFSTFLDIGTGSGCIALALAKNNSSSHGVAIDNSSKALKVARYNRSKLKLSNLKIKESNIFSKIRQKSHFDLIITNPPYVSRNEIPYMSNETYKYEPHEALFAKNQGLEVFQKIFNQLKLKEISFNFLLAEIGFNQKDKLTPLLEKDFSGKYKFIKDLSSKTRFFLCSIN